MNTYFEVKVSYVRLIDKKKVTEAYLADALSCTEAEAIITREIQPFSNGDFKVSNVRETKIAELFERNIDGKWYACRLNALSIDDKKFPVLIYVKAADVKDAEAFVMLQLKKSMAEWVVVSVTETKIIDVFIHA